MRHPSNHLYKDCVIIDVRDPYEYKQGHLDHAINIPFSEIGKPLPVGPFDKLAVYSSSGYHSKLARRTLELRGYEVEDLGDYDSLHLPKVEYNRQVPDTMKVFRI